MECKDADEANVFQIESNNR